MTLSRRAFLRLCGATLVGAALPPLSVALGARRAVFAGRALEQAAVRAAPSSDARVTQAVHPDRVLPLTPGTGGAWCVPAEAWYRVPGGGYVRARQVQPMLPYAPPEIITPVRAPFWAEVVAPITVMRRWPLPDAPALGRVGYGAVLRVIDAGEDDWGHLWYRDGAAGGWVQALHARRLDGEDLAPLHAGAPNKAIVIDAARCRLTAWEGDRAVFTAPVSMPCSDGTCLASATEDLIVRDKLPARQLPAYVGAPWVIDAGALALHGAYWHNDFGAPRPDATGEGITLAPEATRWLYRWVEAGTTRIRVM